MFLFLNPPELYLFDQVQDIHYPPKESLFAFWLVCYANVGYVFLIDMSFLILLSYFCISGVMNIIGCIFQNHRSSVFMLDLFSGGTGRKILGKRKGKLGLFLPISHSWQLHLLQDSRSCQRGLPWLQLPLRDLYLWDMIELLVPLSVSLT